MKSCGGREATLTMAFISLLTGKPNAIGVGSMAPN